MFQSLHNYGRSDNVNNEINIVLALIHNSQLYLCNIGKCRAILCKTDERDVLRAVQLSMNLESERNQMRHFR